MWSFEFFKYHLLSMHVHLKINYRDEIQTSFLTCTISVGLGEPSKNAYIEEGTANINFQTLILKSITYVLLLHRNIKKYCFFFKCGFWRTQMVVAPIKCDLNRIRDCHHGFVIITLIIVLLFFSDWIEIVI